MRGQTLGWLESFDRPAGFFAIPTEPVPESQILTPFTTKVQHE